MIKQNIAVNVDFSRHTITKKDTGVVEGDYNTTRFIFNFMEDVSKGKVMFKMSNPDGKVILLKELVEHEIVLVGYDEDGKACTLFDAPGSYPFELVYYGEDSKITSTAGFLNVTRRWIKLGDESSGVYIEFRDILKRIITLQEHYIGGAVND